jgi:hypothetical protein
MSMPQTWQREDESGECEMSASKSIEEWLTERQCVDRLHRQYGGDRADAWRRYRAMLASGAITSHKQGARGVKYRFAQ